MIKIGIAGCGGRMGRTLLAEVLATEGVMLAAGADRSGADVVGRDLGELAGHTAIGIKAVDSAPGLVRRRRRGDRLHRARRDRGPCRASPKPRARPW